MAASLISGVRFLFDDPLQVPPNCVEIASHVLFILSSGGEGAGGGSFRRAMLRSCGVSAAHRPAGRSRRSLPVVQRRAVRLMDKTPS